MSAGAVPCAEGFASAPSKRQGRRHREARTLASGSLWVAILWLFAAAPAVAYTPDSPEVVELVDRALAYLEKNTDERLGAKCLVALAFLKHGAPASHPRIVEAVEACRASVETEHPNSYIYSKALAIILLAELDAGAHRELIKAYMGSLDQHQIQGGGFGYTGFETGDTSQTQYTALAYWELLNHGIVPEADRVQRCLAWLMRTQDPSGAWGYQGQDPGSYSLVAQPDRVGRSMAAAGFGSTLILGNAVGLLTAGSSEASPLLAEEAELPTALRRVEDRSAQKTRAATVPPGMVSAAQVNETVNRGRAWWDKNFGLEVDQYQYYYMYSIERLKSFEGLLRGEEEPEPDWYNAGVDLLRESQAPEGNWSDGCGDACATAFGVLFLLRSTQQSIKASLGEGTLIGGRGLPRDLSKVRLRGGRLVVQQNVTELDQLLEMMEDGDGDKLDALLSNPAALEVTEVTPEDARRLQQIVRSGSPETRLLAIRALSEARNLDYVPTLIFALTDPDRRVVRAARDGLSSVSRSFEGFGPSDNFDDREREQAIVRWKTWYAEMRPEAAPLP